MSREVANALKQMMAGVAESQKPSDALNATVVEIKEGKPVLQIDGALGPLPAAAVVVPEQFTDFAVEVSGTFHGEDHTGTLTVFGALKAGDKVYVLRKSGAQKYVVIGRV